MTSHGTVTRIWVLYRLGAEVAELFTKISHLRMPNFAEKCLMFWGCSARNKCVFAFHQCYAVPTVSSYKTGS